ncbi:MAG: hypothetical protein KDC16_05345 [Saprospiraceae bacterium]|nr:hypothetical protein [Saprospiraceae bacterium]
MWFTLINIWIVISWFEWTYGASYSSRALSQSLPILALPMAVFYHKMKAKSWLIALVLIASFINIFQIYQYNLTILHYEKMNRLYYSRIFLNPHPTAYDMSTLDNPIYFDTLKYKKQNIIDLQKSGLNQSIFSVPIADSASFATVKLLLASTPCFWDGKLSYSLILGENSTSDPHQIPYLNPLTKPDTSNYYEFAVKCDPTKEGNIIIEVGCDEMENPLNETISVTFWRQ